MEEMKRCVSYLRVSTTEQITNFSLDNQRDFINEKATREGYEIIKEFEDAGESAKNTDRPQLQELLKFCTNKKNNIDSVFVYKWDRFSRSQLDFLTLRQLLSQHGVSLISATETSGTTPEALFLQGILTSAAQYENDLKSARIREGNRKRFTEGYTSIVPLGYKLGYVNGKRCGVASEDFTYIQALWQRAATEKLTLAQIRRELSQRNDKPIHKQTISKMFSNPYYMGQIKSRKYKTTALGMHKAMINEDMFYQVQFALFGIRKPEQKIMQREESPLRGVLLCPHCNKLLTSAKSKSKSGRYIWYYLCTERASHPYFGVNAEKVHEQFLTLLQKIKVTKGAMHFHNEIMREVYEEEYGTLTQTAKQIEKELIGITDMLEELEVNKLKKLYPDEDYLALKDKLKIKYAAKKSLLSEKQIDRIDIETVLNWNAYYLTHLDKCWDKTSLEGKRAMQCSLFPKKINFENKKLRTPEIGLAYQIIVPSSEPVYSRVVDYRTLLEAMVANYQQLNQYVFIN